MLLLCASRPSLAQEADRIALNGEIELARLVDLSAERLGINIEYDSRALTASITLRVGDPLTNDELWSLTNHALSSRGFTTIKSRDGLFSVVKTEAAPWLGTLHDLGSPERLPGFVTVAVRVRHIPIDKAVEALKFVLAAGTAHVAPMPPSNVLLLTDIRPRVERAIELLEQIDQPLPDVTVEVLRTGRLGATALVQAANDILQAREGVVGRTVKGRIVALPDGSGVALVGAQEEIPLLREVIARLEEGEPVRTVAYTPQYFALDEVATLIRQVLDIPNEARSTGSFRLITDPLTGTLLVTATTAQHDQVRALMDRLEAIPPSARRQMRSFAIRNRGVGEVVILLEQLIAARVLEPDPQAGATSVRDAALQQTRRDFGPLEGTSVDRPSAPRPPSSASAAESEELEGPVTLAADEATNTLLAVGEPRVLDQLDELVTRLDVRQPQVLLEVIAVSLSENQSLDLGVELQKLEENGLTQVALSSVFGLFGGEPTSLGDVGGQGFTGLVLSPGDFAVLLRALSTVNEGRSLNRPRVLVNNNEDATFDAVLQQPFLSTNASDTVATTSFGGTQDAGTSISVKPTIAEGDHLVLEYRVSLSEFLGEQTSPALPPPRQQNTLASQVTIPDGHTVVLGGLEVETEADGATGVPWLSELPLLGWLFENRSTSKGRTRFFVFLHATVLRQGRFDDLKFQSSLSRDRVELPEGWPTLEPRIIR